MTSHRGVITSSCRQTQTAGDSEPQEEEDPSPSSLSPTTPTPGSELPDAAGESASASSPVGISFLRSLLPERKEAAWPEAVGSCDSAGVVMRPCSSSVERQPAPMSLEEEKTPAAREPVERTERTEPMGPPSRPPSSSIEVSACWEASPEGSDGMVGLQVRLSPPLFTRISFQPREVKRLKVGVSAVKR